MSLDYDLSKVDKVHWDETDEGWATACGVIFGCIPVGIGEITVENYEEWFARHAVWSQMHGFEVIPLETVCNFIGLRTNVFPEQDRDEWMQRVVTRRLDDVKRMARFALECAE
jgi:hypothetical protein